MDQQPTDENDKRFEVVREIVMTEKQYCVNLDFVIKVSSPENNQKYPFNSIYIKKIFYWRFVVIFVNYV